MALSSTVRLHLDKRIAYFGGLGVCALEPNRAKTPEPRIVAVIPAFNEERFIASVVLTALNHASVVIVVDDGSSDRTADLAERTGAYVVRMEQNGGKGAALNAGFKACRQFDPGAVVILDGDSQHDPADIPSLVAPVIAGDADVVIGSRFLNAKSKIPVWRQFGQHALNVATNVASGVSMTDTQSGYRAFSPQAVEMMSFRSKGLAVESEMQFIFKNLRVQEVPIVVHYLDGNKRNPVKHGLQVVDAILGLAARRRPLLFFSLFSLPLVVLGLWLGASAMTDVTHAHHIPLGVLIGASGSLLAGLVLFVTGITLNTLDSFMNQLHQEIGSLQAEVRGEPEGLV